MDKLAALTLETDLKLLEIMYARRAGRKEALAGYVMPVHKGWLLCRFAHPDFDLHLVCVLKRRLHQAAHA